MGIEGRNILIAEFMVGVVKKNYNGFEIDGKPYHETQLKYHSSWDWLMPVIEKIESLDYIDYCQIQSTKTLGGVFYSTYISKTFNTTSYESKIKSVYNAVIKAINYHNEREQNIISNNNSPIAT